MTHDNQSSSPGPAARHQEHIRRCCSQSRHTFEIRQQLAELGAYHRARPVQSVSERLQEVDNTGRPQRAAQHLQIRRSEGVDDTASKAKLPANYVRHLFVVPVIMPTYSPPGALPHTILVHYIGIVDLNSAHSARCTSVDERRIGLAHL